MACGETLALWWETGGSSGLPCLNSAVAFGCGETVTGPGTLARHGLCRGQLGASTPGHPSARENHEA